MSKPVDNSNAQYLMVERVFEILKILMEETDEYHTLTQAEILEKIETTNNARTLSTTIDKIILALNPIEYYEEDLEKFRIRYKNFDKDLMAKRLDIDEERKFSNTANKKMPSITNLWYAHEFSNDELGKLIEGVYFSKFLTDEEREQLIIKLLKLSSKYYASEYVSKNGKLKNNVYGIYENINVSNVQIRQNINTINQAIKNNLMISFNSNRYNAQKKLEVIKNDKNKNKEYIVSPYYIVAYNNRYYLIANTTKYDNISIYRIDLMTNISITNIPIKNKSDVKGLPLNWNTSKFMSEHMNMFYDEPERIYLKIRNNGYTILHDWFNENYEIIRNIDDEYDEVVINCSPKALVNWAMQYSEYVEVLKPIELRKEIIDKCKNIIKKYKN